MSKNIRLKLEKEVTLGGSKLYHILQLVPFESWECRAIVYNDYPLTLKIAKLLREAGKKK